MSYAPKLEQQERERERERDICFPQRNMNQLTSCTVPPDLLSLLYLLISELQPFCSYLRLERHERPKILRDKRSLKKRELCLCYFCVDYCTETCMIAASNFHLDFSLTWYISTGGTYVKFKPQHSVKIPTTFILNIFTYYDLLTYIRSSALLEEPLIVQPLKNFPTFYGTRRFNTVFTRALDWSLPWATSIQSTPSHPISLRSILILSIQLRLGLPSGLVAQ
jgi:hypothetical protein